MAGLKSATKNTSKGDYYDHKTSHCPQLLARINASWVRDAAPNCRKLFGAILAELG